MSDQRFAVVFSGQLVDGAERDSVRDNLAQLFKVEPAKVEKMFTGKPVLIKKDLDEAKANNYKAALAKAGAIAEIIASDTPTAAPQSSAPKVAPATTAKVEPEEPPSPPVAPDLTIAEVGATIVEYQPMKHVDFNTTQFDLAEVGVTLVEPEPVAPAEFDTTGMELDPPGVLLTEPKPAEPANFDTSSLSLVDDQ